MGRVGFGAGTCCIVTPEVDMVLFAEEDDEDEEEEPSLEGETGLTSALWRTYVSPRSVDQLVVSVLP